MAVGMAGSRTRRAPNSSRVCTGVDPAGRRDGEQIAINFGISPVANRYACFLLIQ
jgi:hypothetical protein